MYLHVILKPYKFVVFVKAGAVYVIVSLSEQWMPGSYPVIKNRNTWQNYTEFAALFCIKQKNFLL